MDFSSHLEKYLTKQEINDLVASFSGEENKGLLLNKKKISDKTFKEMFPNVKKHPLVPHAYLFNKNEYDFGKKVYHELGAYYIQDPSAAIVASLPELNGDEKVLDLCAAPGGKTVQLSLALPKGVLVANDLSKERANILLQNVERLGLDNVVVTSLDFSKISPQFLDYFDCIVLDAPCSGSGMFRKMEEMKDDWTYEKVLKFAAIQKDLILMCYDMLKPGGTLIYSTCSYSYEEDEEVVYYLLEKTPVILQQIPRFDGDYRSKKYQQTVHLFPHLFPGEGQYIAHFKKPGILSKNKIEKVSLERASLNKGKTKEINRYILSQKLPEILVNYALRPGLFTETFIGEKTIPSHHYSHAQDSQNSIPLTKEELIAYLEGQTLIKMNQQNGYFFVSYLGMNIGVVHAVNGVLKNLYPKGLRIHAKINDSF